MTRARSERTPRTTRRPQGTGAISRRRATQQLRALAHPLRLKLLEAFAQGRRTTMQVAAQLGEPPTRLYHHVNALERAGILELVDTRRVRGTTEKYFQLASRQIGSMRGTRVTDESRASLATIATAVFDQARADLLAAMAHPEHLRPETAPLALRMLLMPPSSRLPAVRRRILATLKQIQRESRKSRTDPGATQWALTVAFAPTVARAVAAPRRGRKKR